MDDRQLRSALKRKVLAGYADEPGTRIIDELGLQHGASRIDIAVVNGMVHGYEIKSDRDTLSRLPGQMPIYNAVLDRITLVAAERHAETAVRTVPEWWGVKMAEQGSRGGIRFRTLRRARSNPSIQALAVARLLWRDEAFTLLERLRAAQGLAGQPRVALYVRLAEVAPLDLLRSHVRDCLKRRTSWRFG